MAAPMLALESGEERTDPQLASFGVLTLAVALVVAFGALLGAWLALRSGTTDWPPTGVKIENYYGTTLSVTMIMAALAAEWGIYAVRHNARSQAIAALGLLLFFGLAFLNLLSYTVEVAHFGPRTHPYGEVFFAFNVLMGASVVAAMVVTLVALARLLGRQVSAAEPTLARSNAIFWQAVTMGWFVFYAAVYVVK